MGWESGLRPEGTSKSEKKPVGSQGRGKWSMGLLREGGGLGRARAGGPGPLLNPQGPPSLPKAPHYPQHPRHLCNDSLGRAEMGGGCR